MRSGTKWTKEKKCSLFKGNAKFLLRLLYDKSFFFHCFVVFFCYQISDSVAVFLIYLIIVYYKPEAETKEVKRNAALRQFGAAGH